MYCNLICAGVAVTGFNFGNKISNAIDDVVENGQVSTETWNEIGYAAFEFGTTFAGGVVAASVFDDAIRAVKAGSSVKPSGGSVGKSSRRIAAEKKIKKAAQGSRSDGIMIGKDGDVPVHQSQSELVDSITGAGAKYMGNIRNGDGQIP